MFQKRKLENLLYESIKFFQKGAYEKGMCSYLDSLEIYSKIKHEDTKIKFSKRIINYIKIVPANFSHKRFLLEEYRHTRDSIKLVLDKYSNKIKESGTSRT